MPELYEIRNGYVSDIWEQTEGDLFRSSKDKHSKASSSLLQKMSKAKFVFGGRVSKNSSVPAPRFKTLKEAAKFLFKIEPYEGDQFLIRNVPIYKTHGDTRGNKHVSDHKFLDRMVRNFYATLEATKNLFGESSYGWLPKFHMGHTPNNPDLPERPNAGFWKELHRVEDFLFGDLVVDKHGMEALLSGNYPDRSAEVDIKRGRLLSVAALGFRTPHFALPQMRPDVLRKKYNEMIQKHSYSDGSIKHLITLGEELPMPKTTRKKTRNRASLDPQKVARFFMTLQFDDELNEKFEAAKTEAIQKHMDMHGGQAPNAGSLQNLIMQIIQQMMGQQMNQAPPASSGGTMFNASDALDFESSVHHSSEDQDLEEEGTEVAGGDDPTGLRKEKSSDDTDVDDFGNPTSVEDGEDSGDEDIVTTDGKVQKSELDLDTDDVVKNALNQVPTNIRKQIEPVLKGLQAPIKQMASVIKKQHHAINLLQEKNAKAERARKESIYRNRLSTMFTQGNAAVNSKERLEKHLKFALNLPDKEANEYLTNLEETPALTQLSSRRVIQHSSEALSDPSSMDSKEVIRHRYEKDIDRSIRDYVPLEIYAATEMLDSLDAEE